MRPRLKGDCEVGAARGREEGEKGAVAITVAIAMLVLLGFAALAIDGGLGFDDRRGTQNAADNAALAAAWEACNPANSPADPTGAALAVATENGYDDTAPETTVTVTALSASEYEVVIQTDNDATFAPAGVGTETVTVTSRAVATCEEEPFLGGYAIFAGAEHCSSGGSIELDLTGSTKVIDGGIFSNGDLKINGPNTTVTGEVEFRGSFSSNAGVAADQYLGSPKGYPLEMSILDFRAGGKYRTDPSLTFIDAAGARINNNWMVNNGYATGGTSQITITQSGIYYTSFNGGQDAIDLSKVDTAPGVQVSFVSEGTMHITGNGVNVTGYAPVADGAYTPLMFFSNAGSPPACNTTAIQFSGSDMSWEGLMFAPNGAVQMSASSSNATVNGSIIANTVSVSGSNFEINWQDDGGGAPRFVVELNE
jgi:hypothetical protein